ncbi:hypothetical protein BT96DRAFT_937441 [Gymnopus androsaceus JB14]|uniref:Uncharacterized protein n=1 Tax=Gymnopus androsaceus JB14 TaxID=1447944 RepID=A0A6A4HY80_9AGAR|nr:hypothetical protein BT96DRAFT_937441 [Gymnopus androsaceus JB14]
MEMQVKKCELDPYKDLMDKEDQWVKLLGQMPTKRQHCAGRVMGWCLWDVCSCVRVKEGSIFEISGVTMITTTILMPAIQSLLPGIKHCLSLMGGLSEAESKIGGKQVAVSIRWFAVEGRDEVGEDGEEGILSSESESDSKRTKPIGCKDVNKMVIFLVLGIYLPSSNLAFLTHEITFNMSLHTGIPPTLSTCKSQPPANMQNPPGKDSDPKSHPTMCTDAVGDAEAPPAAEMDLDADSRVSTVGRKKNKENKGGKWGNPGVFMGVHQTFLKKHAAKDLKQAT